MTTGRINQVSIVPPSARSRSRETHGGAGGGDDCVHARSPHLSQVVLVGLRNAS